MKNTVEEWGSVGSSATIEENNKIRVSRNVNNISSTGAGNANSDDAAQRFASRMKFWLNAFEPMLEDKVVIFGLHKQDAFSKDKMEEFIQKFKWFNGSHVNYVTRKLPPSNVNITADNLPLQLANKKLKELFIEHGSVGEVQATKVELPGNTIVEVSPISFNVKLFPGVKIENLPNFLSCGNVKYFFKIRGKERSCFKCSQTGHLANECTKRYCNGCRRMMDESHNCTPSYASKLRAPQQYYNNLFDDTSQENDNEMDHEQFYSTDMQSADDDPDLRVTADEFYGRIDNSNSQAESISDSGSIGSPGSVLYNIAFPQLGGGIKEVVKSEGDEDKDKHKEVDSGVEEERTGAIGTKRRKT